jgi:hypothetical protein
MWKMAGENLEPAHVQQFEIYKFKEFEILHECCLDFDQSLLSKQTQQKALLEAALIDFQPDLGEENQFSVNLVVWNEETTSLRAKHLSKNHTNGTVSPMNSRPRVANTMKSYSSPRHSPINPLNGFQLQLPGTK